MYVKEKNNAKYKYSGNLLDREFTHLLLSLRAHMIADNYDDCMAITVVEIF